MDVLDPEHAECEQHHACGLQTLQVLHDRAMMAHLDLTSSNIMLSHNTDMGQDALD